MTNEWTTNPMKDDRGFLTAIQIKKIISNEPNDRNRLMLKMLAVTGRRISELLMLRVKDIIPADNNAYFIILKKKKKEYILKPIPERIMIELMDYIKVERLLPSEFVFRFTRQYAFQIVRKAGERVGIIYVGERQKKLHPHHFRHSFAVNMAHNLTSPAQLAMLSKLLEHSSVNITMQYLKFNVEDQRTIIEELYS